MNYVHNFENFKKENVLNEAFLGNLFKKLKNKLSLSISKKIGGAKKVDKNMGTYAATISNIIDKKIKAEGEALSKKITSDKSDTPELKQQYLQSKKASDKQIQLLNKQQGTEKDKFDAKMKGVIKGNNLLTDYYNLKKTELASDMIAKELEAYEKLGGGDIDDPEWKKTFQEKQQALQKFQKDAKQLGDKINKEASEEKAVTLDITVGNKFLYPSESAKKDIEVEVVDLQDAKNKEVQDNEKKIKVKTENSEFEVPKGQLKPLPKDAKPEPKEEGTLTIGDQVTYTKNDGNENTGTLKTDNGDTVTLTTDNNADGFEIDKSQIITK